MVLNQPIHSVTPFTLLDYPDKTACIVWFSGCNMACSYCYNPEIVYSKGALSYEDVLTFLTKRIGLLDAVVLSGGECTRAKGLLEFVEKIKNLGFLVKVDSNGSHPMVIEELIKRELINYVALDFKAMPERFYRITKSKLFLKFEQTLKVLIENYVRFEVRTTFHEGLMRKEDVSQMCNFLHEKKYTGTYFIQHFFNGSNTIGAMRDSNYRLQTDLIETFGLKVELRN